VSAPPKDDHREAWRSRITAAIAQGLSRELLLIILREVWRQGPWHL
jgi:hypothetical protein